MAGRLGRLCNRGWTRRDLTSPVAHLLDPHSAVIPVEYRRKLQTTTTTCSSSSASPSQSLHTAFGAPTPEEMGRIHVDIIAQLNSDNAHLEDAARYYFDGAGKLVRFPQKNLRRGGTSLTHCALFTVPPTHPHAHDAMQMRPYIVTIMGRACRSSLPDPSCESSKWPDQIEMNQNQVAKITEMIHTASLVHDDVLDEATTRRNKTAVNVAFTAKECVLAGDAILAKATYMLAEIGNVRVIEIFSQVGPSPTHITHGTARCGGTVDSTCGTCGASVLRAVPLTA